MLKLPIGISSFTGIRSDDYVYVDKTSQITKMLQGKYYFLSRPRRFGKSLLVDTIKEMFSGNRELFYGLAAYDSWNWDKHPVILIDFAESNVTSKFELNEFIENIVQKNAQRLGVVLPDPDKRTSNLGSLIDATHKKYNESVVVLIDEYDKPLLDNVTESYVEHIRDGLRGFYSAIKAYDQQLRFVLLTGVSKFSKVSIFSGLNNLLDITTMREYSALCGYSQSELEANFAEWLEDVDLKSVQEWYNGYSWGGIKVYNPFDILLFLANGKKFGTYWFETGTPTFLIRLLHEGYHHLPDYEELPMRLADLGRFDLDHTQLEAVLFQTGYLTIKHIDEFFDEPTYYLGFPNKEVRSAFTYLALSRYLLKEAPDIFPMKKALATEDIPGIESCLRQLFASIANDNYRNNTIAHYEGYYAAVVYAYLASLGLSITAEDVTNRGRIDLSIELNNRQGRRVVYLCEFKVSSGDRPCSPVEQITERGYADKYRAPDTTIHLIGIEFNSDIRTLSAFEHAVA